MGEGLRRSQSQEAVRFIRPEYERKLSTQLIKRSKQERLVPRTLFESASGSGLVYVTM